MFLEIRGRLSRIPFEVVSHASILPGSAASSLIGITVRLTCGAARPAQPAVKDAEHAQVHTMSRAVEVPHTLHPFTAGCIWKMRARRRQVQPDVIRSVE